MTDHDVAAIAAEKEFLKLTQEEEFLLWNMHTFPDPRKLRFFSEELQVKRDYLVMSGFFEKGKYEATDRERLILKSNHSDLGKYIDQNMPHYCCINDHNRYVCYCDTLTRLLECEEDGEALSNLWGSNNNSNNYDGQSRIYVPKTESKKSIDIVYTMLNSYPDEIDSFTLLWTHSLIIPTICLLCCNAKMAVLALLAFPIFSLIVLFALSILQLVTMMIIGVLYLISISIKEKIEYTKSIYDMYRIPVLWLLKSSISEVKRNW